VAVAGNLRGSHGIVFLSEIDQRLSQIKSRVETARIAMERSAKRMNAVFYSPETQLGHSKIVPGQRIFFEHHSSLEVLDCCVEVALGHQEESQIRMPGRTVRFQS
jgi:hypothetical protein